MPSDERTPAPDVTCACWGPLEKWQHVHTDCEPVVTENTSVLTHLRGLPTPRVCTCECATCKRAWWAAGRPRVVEVNGVRTIERAR